MRLSWHWVKELNSQRKVRFLFLFVNIIGSVPIYCRLCQCSVHLPICGAGCLPHLISSHVCICSDTVWGDLCMMTPLTMHNFALCSISTVTLILSLPTLFFPPTISPIPTTPLAPSPCLCQAMHLLIVALTAAEGVKLLEVIKSQNLILFFEHSLIPSQHLRMCNQNNTFIGTY